MTSGSWQHVSEPATPAETDGERIARGWLHSGEPMAGLARRIDEDRATLACAIHRACKRIQGGCCTIGSVIGAWDARWTEIAQERDRLAGERDALRAALLAARDHDAVDGAPCWDRWPPPGTRTAGDDPGHGPLCLQARVALGIGQGRNP